MNFALTDHAAEGLCYLTGNAGVWRLLVPDAVAVSMLAEMRTGKIVRIEASVQAPDTCVDIVFDDGSN